MIASGNMTSGYMNFLTVMGVANSTKPSHAEGLNPVFPVIPFFSWDASYLRLLNQRDREINNPARNPCCLGQLVSLDTSRADIWIHRPTGGVCRGERLTERNLVVDIAAGFILLKLQSSLIHCKKSRQYTH
jgi:hypothetical protein